MVPEPGPVLDYATPQPRREAPQPIGFRALVTGAVVAGVGVVATLLREWLRGAAGVTVGITYAILCMLALAALCETLFFRRNVSDPTRAVIASAANVGAAVGLLALWRALYV